MNVQIQSVKFDADARLVSFIEQKIAKLDRFVVRRRQYLRTYFYSKRRRLSGR